MTLTTIETTNTHVADLDLVREQMELEMGMKDAGIVRFRKMMEQMRKTKQEDGTSYGERIVGGYIERVAAALEAWVKKVRVRQVQSA